jgi:hypothetical protein
MSTDFQLRGFATAAAYEDAVLDGVRVVLDLRLSSLLETGALLPEPSDLAEAMAAGIPDVAPTHPYARLLGPFYSSGGVMRFLKVPTKQALSDRRHRGTVLAAQTDDGTWVYPSFQFDPKRARVHRALVPVLSALRGAPRWGAALWLTTGHPDLADRTPLAATLAGDDADTVVELAGQYAAAVTGP